MTAPDRRIRRTRDALHLALIESMLERGYERVTVSDIIARADIGRSTFYAHYRDKDDLLVVSCTEFLRREIADSPDRSPLAPVRIMIDLAGGYPDIYRALVGPKSSATALRGYRRSIATVLEEHFTARLRIPADELADTVTVLSWALIGVLGTIVDRTDPTPPAVAWRRFESFCRTGFGPALATAEKQVRRPTSPDADSAG
ncbi:TetR/AcrR family transcriptional regulator [Nocardia paucivorans]|uniref:TetR/AcrR family transcriptional regulator n=1 Tax=Nocardia paucivorans TaxID=114259 RepID=UPI000687C4CE|nr:TetR/AcrR family transcriptional regulator [Nocardia paucivorans]